MRRRWPSVPAALIVAALLSACLPRPPAEPPILDFRPVPLDPAAEYTVRLWDFRYPLGPVAAFETGGERYRERLEAVLEAFRQAFPNVEVELTLLDFAAGDRALLEALAAGDPPDVFASWWECPLPDHELRVPVAPYLGKDEAEAYHPLAWRLAGTAAWPRWLCPLIVLGRMDALAELDPAALWSAGWEWGDLAAAAVRATRQGAGRGIRYGLVAASGESALRWLLGSQGAGLFTRGPELPQALGWVRQAVDGGALLVGERADDRSVDLFLSGMAAFILGANPALARRLAAVPGVVPLPVPRFAGAVSPVPVAATHLLVFRQREFKGMEHTQAAIELARWLSRAGGLFPGELLLGAPAWQAQREDVVELALQVALERGPGLYPGYGSRPEEIEATLAARELVAGWWAGRLTDGELEERLGVFLPVFAPRR